MKRKLEALFVSTEQLMKIKVMGCTVLWKEKLEALFVFISEAINLPISFCRTVFWRTVPFFIIAEWSEL